MTTSSLYRSSPLFRFITNACALLAVATLVACGTHLKPTIADVSDRAVEVVEAGVGDATVVFESGLGNDWAPWDDVASEVAGRARVFAYSRPGYGGSDPSEAPRTATRIVEDLRALLTARGLVPPYILVGHSFGGTYMELFAKAHPEEVVGLVLVDSRHRDFTAACQSAGLWQSMHGALAHEAAHGEQIVFEGASHNLEIDRAHEVAEVILSLVPASKN